VPGSIHILKVVFSKLFSTGLGLSFDTWKCPWLNGFGKH
jgi:hypothetical protein